MAIEICVREFDPWVRDAYKKLFADDVDKTPELLHWRFLQNPHGPAKFVVAEHDGQPAGMIALIPTKLANLPDCGPVYQAIDTMVDLSFRGKGLFVEMGKIVHQSGALVWGFPNRNAAPGWFGSLGWTNRGSVPLLMRPLRSGYFLARVHSRLRSVDLPLTQSRRSDGIAYDHGELMAAEVGQLWGKIRPAYGITVDRTSDWLNWRLMGKPNSEYRCVSHRSSEGDLAAFVASKISAKHGANICYVMEALCAEAGQKRLATLLRTEMSNALAAGAEVALAWCPTFAPSYRSLRSAGFLPVPARMRPIEINFGFRVLDGDCSAANAPTARWYVSYLDSDTN